MQHLLLRIDDRLHLPLRTQNFRDAPNANAIYSTTQYSAMPLLNATLCRQPELAKSSD